MARTFVDQPTQVFHSDDYNDQFATGINLVSSSTNLEDDLNALRTQVKALLWGTSSYGPGAWYSDVVGVANLSPARGLNTINSALTTVEQQRFIYDIQSLAYVVIPSGSNFVSLSVSGSTAPSGLAAPGLGAVTGSFTGSIVALLPGQAGNAHSLNLVSGTSAITPRNLVAVRDAYTHLAFSDPFHGNHEIYGLLQINSGAVDGTAFADTDPGETQISFVVEFPSGTFVAANTGSIGGKIINYQYRARVNYLGLPEDAYTNTVFVDVTPITSGFAALTDITLQRAINNQGNTVVTDTFATTINLAGGGSWTFSDGNKTLLSVLQAGGGTVAVSASFFDVDSIQNNFRAGLAIATGSSNPLYFGINAGVIESTNGLVVRSGNGNLRLDAQNGFLQFIDQFGTTVGTGSINFSKSTLEWNRFYDLFGPNETILGAFDALSSSLSSSYVTRTRASAGVTAQNINSNVNVTFPTNIDAALLNYSTRDFIKDMNVYLNGILLLPGRTSGDPNDVYPGTSPATGDLKFPMKLRTGSIISMEIFGH